MNDHPEILNLVFDTLIEENERKSLLEWIEETQNGCELKDRKYYEQKASLRNEINISSYRKTPDTSVKNDHDWNIIMMKIFLFFLLALGIIHALK